MSVPPPPPGFRLNDEQPAPAERKGGLFRGARKRATPPPEGFVLGNPTATDGDTVRSGDARVRVVGVDAPEIKQLGYDRQGNALPIGEQSRAFLQDTLGRGTATVGPSFGSSWGRRVAPVNVGQTDAGLASLRYGQGFAAPEYLLEDPSRMSDYVQAESRARTNRLGVHGVYTQTPAEFRDNPVTSPATRDMAQFWDTPTPLQPLAPEVRDGYAELLRNGTAAEINAFLTANGYETSRPEDLRAWVARRDAGDEVEYAISQEAPPLPMIDLGGGATGAGVRKFGSGFLAGGLDEIGAVVDTLGGTEGRESVWNSDRRLADIWANNQSQNAAGLSYDQTTYPTASTIGEVSGALASGFAIPYGQGARTVPQLARVGGVYGGAEGFLGTDGRTAERLTGAAIGVPVGAAVNAVGGKALEYGMPVAARAYRALTGRSGNAGANAAGETVEAYGEEQALDSALEAAGDAPAPPPGFRLDAQPMADNASPSLSVEPSAGAYGNARRLLDPTTRAQLLASSANVSPGDMLPMPSNFVDGVEDSMAAQVGRFAAARAPNERDALTRYTLTSYTGQEVPKVGPVDMVGWLRTVGGLRDQGGELSHMGIVSNAARRGLEHVGQEARFGPLVQDQGMTLDDAALAAWEAGYFPELRERPDVNTFLDALRDTYNGGAGRRFRPDDAPEVEAYENLQTERYDFEQDAQEAGGRLWQDRSEPAEGGAPFPPVRAYEEWPAEAVERVGNINLANLDSPQDISRALAQTEKLVGFDAATRGRVTQAETELLAADLGMTADKLLSRRKGQAFNAEEALAARQILAKSGNELVNAAKRMRALGDDPGAEALAEFRQKWVRHAAIQEQVAGMTAEAGRALQQFRQGADSRAVRGDVLSAFVRAGGGGDNLKDAADALLDAVEMGPGKFNAFAAKAMKPKWRQKIGELYINMLLSNPPTHIVNMVSNTLTSMLQVPEYAAGAAVGAARRALGGKDAAPRILSSEVGARAFGLIQGTKEGASLFAKALRTGDADDFVSKVEGDEYKAISGLKGEAIRLPTRFLTAEDQLFKGIARRMALNGLAARKAAREGLSGGDLSARIAELVSDPPADMFEEAMEYGRYLTFQNKLGPSGQAVSSFTSNNLPGKIIVPFVRTPINLLKFATERSPAAPLLKEFRDDFQAGGERRDLAIARMMLGTGLAATMYQAAQDGTITGAVPPDPKKAKLLYADGWQPYSVRVGDQWVSYSRLDPLSTTIGVAADMATLPEGLSDRQADDKGTMLVASIMGNLASKTWLSGATAFVEGLSDPGRYAGSWLQRTAGAFAVPAGVAGVARSMDPILRRRESIGEAIQARVPGLSDDLLPRRDVFGEPVELGNWGPDFLSPFWASQQKNDPVVGEMLRIGAGVSEPGKTYTDEGQRVEYAPEEYDRYHEIAGRLTYNRLLGLVGSGEYSGMGDDARRKAVKKAIREARKTAREVLGYPAYPLPAKGALPPPEPAARPTGGAAVPPPPPGFRVEGESAGVNYFRDVQEAIPGVGVTSGYRTPEYQADMRRRGYNPAPNSAHLSGSALDLTPPPGRSMSWLQGQVAERFPNARALNEGDHLHVVFPGYYGAPVLGGAQGAGVVNPYSNVPPPPPGFSLN
ncbi:phage-related protein [Qipengyuania citrea LAMA 915]|uniref:Phage-related protein n=1 Tax=Qipengyuania citrea LAMA 915 TaxID=1306953 RepID=A0A0L1KH07_9SPHN|nr:hypothetical protein [Qipengyuania citrea]KNH03092.1 phage-related protein [Qipengyuania citrea LAMA 915]